MRQGNCSNEGFLTLIQSMAIGRAGPRGLSVPPRVARQQGRGQGRVRTQYHKMVVNLVWGQKMRRRLVLCKDVQVCIYLYFIFALNKTYCNFCGAAPSQTFFSLGRQFPCGFGPGIPISQRESARVRGTRYKICWVWEMGAWDYINNFLGFPIQSRISFG